MRVVIGLFVWPIEPRWCVIKFVINKSTFVFFYILITNCKNMFKLFQFFLQVIGGFHAISCKNTLSWIPQIWVQGLTVLLSDMGSILFYQFQLIPFSRFHIEQSRILCWSCWRQSHHPGSKQITKHGSDVAASLKSSITSYGANCFLILACLEWVLGIRFLWQTPIPNF